MSQPNLHRRLIEAAENHEVFFSDQYVSAIDNRLLSNIGCRLVELAEARTARPFPLIDRLVPTPYRGMFCANDLFTYIIRNNVGLELINKSGKFNVRLKKTLRKLGIGKDILSDDDYCKISSVIGDYIKNQRLYYRFVNKFDWTDGDFGDGGSCYWGDRAAARDTLEHYKALAVQFFDHEPARGTMSGTGRAWVAPLTWRGDGAVVVFNRYGTPRAMKEVIDLLCRIDQSLQATWVNLVNDGGSSDILYVNGDACVLSYEPVPSTRIDLEYDIVEGHYYETCGHYYECDNCGDRIDEDDVYHVEDDHLCEYCYQDCAASCEHCGDAYYTDNMYQLTDDRGLICNYCRQRRNYVQCNVCDGWTDNVRETTTGSYVCESCAEDMVDCDHCGLLMDDDENHLTHDDDGNEYNLCDRCYGDHGYECEQCHELFYDAGSRESDICEACERDKENECKED